MSDDRTDQQPTKDSAIDFYRTYSSAVQIIAESLQELSNVACTRDEYVHNAKAILARLAHAGIIVDDVNEGKKPDASSEREHPVKIGDVISGLRVVQTSWPEGDVPMYKLYGESEWRRLYRPIPPRPDTQSHQPNVSYVNTGPSSHRSHTYGNTYGKLDSSQSETRPAVDRSQPASYLETMRRLHPVRLGDVIDGLRVVETFWRSSPEEGDVPCYKLQGDREPRVFTKPIS
jgi:hypothetical protein